MRLRDLCRVAKLRRRAGGNPSLVDAHLHPELAGDLKGIDSGRLPPGALVPGPVHLAMVRAAERDGEFIARLAPERTGLGVPKMMRIRWFTATDQTRHLDDGPQVLTVAVAAGGGDRKHA